VWTTPWVVHAQPAGNGQRVLDYLARYLFRVAICNGRIDRIDDDQVTFHYRDNRTQKIRRATLAGVEFLRRFLQHVLPRRFTKVRYFGLWSRARRSDLDHAQQLREDSACPPPPPAPPSTPSCPLCRAGTLVVIAVLRRQPQVPP
jgi:Putative transposase